MPAIMAVEHGQGVQNPPPAIEDLIELAGARTRLQRDKAMEQIQGMLDHDTTAVMPVLVAGARCLLDRDAWEQRVGGVKLATLCVPLADDAFARFCTTACSTHLEDPEVRVRLGVCDLLRALAARRGAALWDDVGDRVLLSIDQHFDRDALLRVRPHPGDDTTTATVDSSDTVSEASVHSTQSYLSDLLASSYRTTVPGTGELRHDTEGWKCLETSFLALRAVMEGAKKSFTPHITPELRGLVYTALVHKNRFVREAALYIVAAMVDTLDDEAAAHILPELAPQLRRGMGDNWSMVRYAACVATRSAVQRARHDDSVMSVLIPPICLNRYYVAEGVRAYSQATWLLVAGDRGRDLVAKHIDALVEHYLWCSKGSNHAVREAACACMAEVLTKVDAAERHAPRLLHSLLLCFKDASWPVRAAACDACGQCIAARPDACAFALPELYPLFEAHLSDNVPSVRQDAAIALGRCVRAYPTTALEETVAPMLRHLLPRVRAQPPEDPSPAMRERVASVRTEEEDRARFTNQPMFSCDGPNLTTSVVRRAGGCGEDAGPSRPAEPWESSDGALYLLREVANAMPDAAHEFLPLYAELACYDGFAQAHKLRETAWRIMRPLAEAVGKRAFKQDDVFEQVLRGLARSVGCGAKGCESAAASCVEWLRTWIGEGVWRGRVELVGGDAVRLLIS